MGNEVIDAAQCLIQMAKGENGEREREIDSGVYVTSSFRMPMKAVKASYPAAQEPKTTMETPVALKVAASNTEQRHKSADHCAKGKSESERVRVRKRERETEREKEKEKDTQANTLY